MKRNSQALFIFTCIAALVSGCENQAIIKALPAGAAVLGGAACYKLFEGKNQKVATAICAAGGLWLGEKLRAHLNQQEQAQLAEATYATLDNRRPLTIKTATGTTIRTELVKSSRPNPASYPTPNSQPPRPQSQSPATNQQPIAEIAGATATECGTVKQTILTNDNQRFEDAVNACKKDGVWVTA